MKDKDHGKKVYIKTFGCQMNVYDSGKIQALLSEDGYVPVAEPEEADLILVNTCSVREKPEHKLHSFIGSVRPLKKQGVSIGIAGCMAQHDGERLFARYRKDVDLVFGPDQVPRVRELVARSQKERVLDNRFMDLENYPFVDVLDPVARGGTSAFVTIQKGCDNKCTFCIVPATRGIEVSRPSEQILREVTALVKTGTREVTLIGQNVNSYGLKVAGERSFAQLLYAVAEVPGVERIRYTTSHPRDMGPDVIAAYRDIPELCSHLHLPVQSGSNRILRRMKRFYSREHYLQVVADLREARPDISLSTDVIVGFPGETEEDFEETMSLLEEVRFDASFSFLYSPRPGTPALRLEEERLERPVLSKRLTRFQERQREIQQEQNQALEGSVQEVLVEGASKWDPDVVCGRTSCFRMVNFPGEVASKGKNMQVRITRAFVNTLRGEAVADA